MTGRDALPEHHRGQLLARPDRAPWTPASFDLVHWITAGKIGSAKHRQFLATIPLFSVDATM